LVTIAGMRQSGSTLLYNVVFFLYQAHGIEFDCGYISRFDALDQSKRLLVKSHEYEPRVHDGAFIISTRRDVRDAVASRFRRAESGGRPITRIGAQSALSWANRQIALHAAFQPRAQFEFVYEDYKLDPAGVVHRIQEILFDRADSAIAKEAIQRAETLHKQDATPQTSAHGDGGEFDRHLLSKSHVTNGGIVGGYRSTLTAAEIADIEGAHGGWLRRYGYL